MRRPSFTLVELLVVVATIAFLIAISLPSLHSSRQQAKAVLCSSNVRQLTFGLLMYETQNQTLPYGFNAKRDINGNPIQPPGGYPGNANFDRKGWWWFNYVSDYSKKDKGKKAALWCPARQIENIELEGYVLHGNYGVNQSICKQSQGRPNQAEFIGMPLSINEIPRPGETLLIMDSGYSIISWWHATDEPPVSLGNTFIEDTAYIPGLKINKDRELWPGQEKDAIYGRHPNKTVNVGFVDSHVSHIKADYLFVEKTGDGYKNKSPLWVPK